MMFLLFTCMVIMSIFDIKELYTKNQGKEILIYVILMVLIGAFGYLYFTNPDAPSFAKIMLYLIGQRGELK